MNYLIWHFVKIGGLQKVSLIDFPEKIAAVVFTQGCNFRCQFCHNEELVLPKKFGQPMNENGFFEFLKKRKGKIEAVVISGGEPTLHSDLPDFMKRVKDFGFLVKLDTNGTNPEVLRELYQNDLVDYVAMDIKHKFEKYSEIVDVPIDIEAIKKSIELIKTEPVDYEFRTTVVPQFHSIDDLKSIAVQLSGAKKFILQEFLPNHAMNKSLKTELSIFSPKNEKLLEEIVNFFKLHIENVSVRKGN